MQCHCILSNTTYKYLSSWSLSEMFYFSSKPATSSNSQHQFSEVGSWGLFYTESTEKLTLFTYTHFVCFVLFIYIFALYGCSVKFLLKRQILVPSSSIWTEEYRPSEGTHVWSFWYAPFEGQGSC